MLRRAGSAILRRQETRWYHYPFSVVFVVLLGALLHWLSAYIPIEQFPYPHIMLLMTVSFYFGAVPALAGAVTAWVVFTLTGIEPEGQLLPAASTTEEWTRQGVFCVGSLLGIWFSHCVRRNAAWLERRTRELEEAQRMARIGSWELDVATGEVEWSPQIYEVLGQNPKLPPPDLGRHQEIFTPESWVLLERSIEQVVTLGKPYEIELRSNSGTWIRASGEPVNDAAGKVVGLRGTAQDITRLKLADHALRESEERFRTLADSTPVMIWVHDAAGALQFVNRAYTGFFGITAEEAQGEGWQPLVHPDDSEAYVQGFQESMRDRKPFRATARVKRHDGQWRWVESHAVPRISQTGEFLGFAGSSPDVTERVLAEEALLSSREMLIRAEEIGNTGCWEWDIASGRLDWSLQTYRIFGKEPATFIPALNSFLDCIDPDHREMSRALVDSALNDDKLYDVEYPIIRPSGEVRWLHTRGEVTRDPLGNPVRMNGVTMDITERKAAEQALAEASAAAERRAEEIRVLMEAAPVGVFVAEDPSCARISGNTEARRMTGTSQDVNLSKSAPEAERPKGWQEMADGVALEPSQLPLQRAARGEEVRNVEMEIAFANGDVKHVIGNASPLWDASGKPRGAIAVLMDITERRLAQKELTEAESHKLEFYRKTLAAATKGKLLIAATEYILAIVGPSLWQADVATPEQYREVRQAVEEKAALYGMTDEMFWRLDSCVGEMLANAIRHAGGGTASIHAHSGKFFFVVSDRGAGIAAMNLPDVALIDGYTTAGTGGLGYRLITESADRTYLSTDSNGTTVAVELLITQEPEASEARTCNRDASGSLAGPAV